MKRSAHFFNAAVLAAATAADAIGWPALALQKAALPVTRHFSGSSVSVSLSNAVGEPLGWIVMVSAGKEAVTIQAAIALWPMELTTVPAMQTSAVAQVNYLPLNINSPTPGAVGFGKYVYYSYNAPKPLQGVLSVVVTPFLGDADLYVTVDGSDPSQSNWQYQSTSLFTLDKVTLGPNDPGKTGQFCSNAQPSATCPIRIAVFGYLPATFTITVTSDTGPAIPLSSGIPMVDAVGAGSVAYYSLRSQAPAPGGSFAFSLTVAAGSPMLYASSSAKESSTPNSTSYCWAAMPVSGRATITVGSGDPTGCYCSGASPQCTYFIGVQGSVAGGSTSSFIILALEEGNSTELEDGLPLSGVVLQGVTDQFVLRVNPLPGGVAGTFRRMVEVALLPLAGNPDLFITVDGRVPGPSSYDYRSMSAEGIDYVAMRDTDAVIIASPCKNWTVSCTVNVGVYGYSDAAYLIAADSGARPLSLLDGLPFTAGVDAGYYAFFDFTVFDSNVAVVIAVQALTGHTATYVGSQAQNKTLYPTSNPGSYIWRAVSLASNVVVIEATDPNVCPFLPCTYTIGVRSLGNENASFTILARTRDASPTALAPGVPLLDVVGLKDYSRYTASFDRSLGYLEVTVGPLYGDPDLYLALDNRTVSPTNYQYSSAISGQDDDIIVYPTDSAFIASCGRGVGPCTANIAVFGFTTSAYVIQASNGLRLLSDGQTTTGRVGPGLYSYFALDVIVHTPVTITVTPVAGDPDIYVSVTVQRPTEFNSTWDAAGEAVESLVVDPADPRAASCFSGPTCRIYIGVQAYGTAAAVFRIGGTSGGVLPLPIGIPVEAQVPPGGFAYFLFSAPDDAVSTGLEFVAAALTSGGDVTIFVGTQKDAATGMPLFPSKNCLNPSCDQFVVDHATWDSGDGDDRGEVRILPGDPNLIGPGLYSIGIYSDSGCSVGVTGAIGNTIKSLTPGLPFEDEVSVGANSFFQLALTEFGVDVNIQVTPLSGDPDLYVSIHASNTNPTRGNSDRSSYGYGQDEVFLSWPELLECQAILDPAACGGTGNGTSACICYIYIGVNGATNASFTVLAEVANNGTTSSRLLDGVPQSGSVQQGRWSFYYADISLLQGITYSFQLKANRGDPDLYVTTDGLGPPSISPVHYQYSSTHYAGDENVNVQPGSSGYNVTTRAWVGVYGFSGNSTYTLTFVTASGVTQLSETRPSTGTLQAGTYAFFSYVVSTPATSTVSFTVTSISGNADLYVSVWPITQPRYRPSSSAYTWKGTATGQDTVTISPADPKRCRAACNLIVAVNCASVSGGCRYTLSVTNSGSGTSIVRLSQAVPQGGSVLSGQYTYFSFDAGASGRNIAFRVTPTGTGDAQLVVTNAYIPGQSSTASALPLNLLNRFVWSSARGFGTGATGTGAVSIPFNDPRVLYNTTLYVIGVYGVTAPTPSPGPSQPSPSPPAPVSFVITASTDDIPAILTPGVPTLRNYVATGSNAHYSVFVTDVTQDLVLVASLNDGTVTLAISPVGQPLPACTSATTCGNAQWTSVVNNVPTNMVRIAAPLPSVPSVGPCVGPYVHAACSPTDWRTGQYFITVFGVTNADFALTAFTSTGYAVLVEGQPQEDELPLTIGSPPAIFAYRTSPDLRLPEVRLSVNCPSTSIVFYMRSCVDRECTPADQVPGPTNSELSAQVPAGVPTDVFINKFMQGAYCAAPVGATCVYFVSVSLAAGSGPGCPSDPTGATCAPVPFTIVAASQSGRYANIVQQTSIKNKVYSITGNVQTSSSALYELFLAGSGAVDVTVDLQACTNGYPTLYVCNGAPTSGLPCTDPFNPSAGAGASTGSATTAPQSASAPGVVRWLERGITASNYFLSVAADTTVAAPLAAGNWMFQLMISSGTAYYLRPGGAASAPAVTVTSVGPYTLNVSWPQSVVVDDENNGVGAALGARYYVYPARGGFLQPNSPGTISTTACGIFLWAGSQEEDVIPVATPRGQTWALMSGLDAGASYELAVIAECDAACWKQFSPQLVDEVHPGHTLGQAPGYVTQRVVYPVVSASGGPGGGGGAATPTILPVAGIVGIAVGLLLMGGAAGACVVYRRSHTLDRTYQYSALDLSGPEGSDAGMSGGMSVNGSGAAGVADWGSHAPTGRVVVANTLVRAGPGLLSRIRESFVPTQAPGSVGRGASGMADSQYSEVEDRVNAYM